MTSTTDPARRADGDEPGGGDFDGPLDPVAQPRVVVDAPLAPPTANKGLLAVFQQRFLLKLLVQREISARYQGSFLGLLWSYINPLTQFFIYFVVIGIILDLHRNVPNFPVHIFAALVVVHFFTETFAAGTRSIVRNRSIVQKMALPREMFPVASMLVSLFHVVPQLVIMLAVCLIYGWTPDPVGIFCAFLGLLVIMCLGTAGALMFSAANVFFRDFGNIVNVLNNFVRFGVPMIYSYDMVDERFGALAPFYLFNPLADAVLLMQRAFWVGTVDDPSRAVMPDNLVGLGFIMLGVSIVLLAVSQVVFTRLENKIPERL